MTEIKKLIFVYNADSGAWSAFVDSTKKVLMIKGCALCRITHGLAGEKSDWKDCQEELGVPVDYYHKDDMPGPVKKAVDNHFPAILADDGETLHFLLGEDVMERCRGNVHDLKGKILYYASSKNLEIAAVPKV